MVFNQSAPKTLICFHGFGQKASDYEWLSKQHTTYRLISINLFFHENSQLNPNQILSPTSWNLYLEKLIQIESIKRFSVVGYSMGGRFALATLSLCANQIDELFLIAPDGLVEGFWFKFATKNKTQRGLFKAVLKSYPTFLIIANSLSKLGFLNKGLLKFAKAHLHSKTERNRVYNTWTSFKELRLSPTKLNQALEDYKINCFLILGNCDRVIPIKRIEPRMTESHWLKIQKIPVSHHKLFYYNFLDPPDKSPHNSIE